jgi:UDP-N-acetylglucosamine--N-acetylmuramyl-(pentapeptide) pyrophosphoryl-undecaprenol N-acetylglucosamine transferase
MSTFVLAAGGTGGHLFPAEALAARLLADGGTVYLTTDDRVDSFSERLPGVGIRQVRAGRLGGGPLRAACGIADIALGIVQARRLLRQLRPAAVVGFGGYASVPTMLAAAQLGLPTVIHEQNAVLGRANRLLAPRAQAIATGFPETAGLRPQDRGRAVHTGNPVRPAILALGSAPYDPPSPAGAIQLLVFGGSQGASIFAELVPAALALLPEELRARIRLAQQARPEDRAAVVERLAAIGIAAEVESFFTDVPQRLARAHLVVCRSGASTIAELAAVGRPALLVPYPHAMDDHQSANARAFAASGGGWALPQADLTAAGLAERLAALFQDTAAMQLAAAAARRFSYDDAAERLASVVRSAAPVAQIAEQAA